MNVSPQTESNEIEMIKLTFSKSLILIFRILRNWL